MTLKKTLSDMHQYILPSHDRPIYVLYRRHLANSPCFRPIYGELLSYSCPTPQEKPMSQRSSGREIPSGLLSNDKSV